jgi:hypothetical protein
VHSSEFADSNEPVVSQVVPTVVGYANEGIVENLLPGNAKVLFGAEAIKNRLHLRLVQPMTDGVIDDLSAARDFARHIRSLINPPEDAELRAVIGLPANAERSARENLRQAVAGVFDRVILIPEPFLAALGYRDESCLGDSRMSTRLAIHCSSISAAAPQMFALSKVISPQRTTRSAFRLLATRSMLCSTKQSKRLILIARFRR